jgi:hypothetical protein
MKKQRGWDVFTLLQIYRSKDNNRSNRREVEIKINLQYILEYLSHLFHQRIINL